jgi:hypothetical protein
MAFWKTKNGLILGDDPLDVAEEFLDTMAKQYVVSIGRKPRLKEVLSTLASVLERRAEEFVDDGDAIVVSDITAKTKKRPRNQTYRPGDVIAIPLAKHFAFARVAPQHDYLEFYNLKSKAVLPTTKLRGKEVIRVPYLPIDDAIKDWQWKVVGHIPYENGEFKYFHYLVGGRITCNETFRDKTGFVEVELRKRDATPEELTSVPQMQLYAPEDVLKDLSIRLRDAPIVS